MALVNGFDVVVKILLLYHVVLFVCLGEIWVLWLWTGIEGKVGWLGVVAAGILGG